MASFQNKRSFPRWAFKLQTADRLSSVQLFKIASLEALRSRYLACKRKKRVERTQPRSFHFIVADKKNSNCLSKYPSRGRMAKLKLTSILRFSSCFYSIMLRVNFFACFVSLFFVISTELFFLSAPKDMLIRIAFNAVSLALRGCERVESFPLKLFECIETSYYSVRGSLVAFRQCSCRLN